MIRYADGKIDTSLIFPESRAMQVDLLRMGIVWVITRCR
jgi:hypothetical protein